MFVLHQTHTHYTRQTHPIFLSCCDVRLFFTKHTFSNAKCTNAKCTNAKCTNARKLKCSNSECQMSNVTHYTLHTTHTPTQQEAAENQLYEDSLQSEQLAIDLMLASKVDSYTQLILDQSRSTSSESLGEIPQNLVAYVPQSIEQYKKVLQAYYDALRESNGAVPPSPPLHFKVIEKHGRR